MVPKIALAVFAAAIAFPGAYADDSPVPPAMINATTAAESSQTEVDSKDDGTVSLDFREADIRNILRILAYKSGVNIVAGPEVTGVVTIQLDHVPWQRALEVILSTYGYGYDQKDNIITVTTIESLKKRREDAQLLSEQEPLTTKTFLLNYAKASTIVESIEKMKTPRGTINYDERTNTLILRDIPANVELIGGVIAKLDTTTPQVLIEAKIIETTLTNKENLGIDWTTQVTLGGAKKPTIFPFTTSNISDKIPYQFPAPKETEFSFGTLNFAQLQAVMEFLKTRSNTNILSSPRIVTLDNQKADIKVGSQYPIPTYTYNEQQARLQVSGWEYKDIGIIFDVTPHVNSAGFVTLEIAPTVTDILDYVTVENTQLPRLSSESAITNVMIKDGQTLVIAGLIKNKTDDTKKRVPFLGDIPVVGKVFQKSNQNTTKTELLIFLTPHIITPNNPSTK